MIKLKHVEKNYGSGESIVYALKDVNLIIEDSKLTAVIGKSGSGKTTLVNIIGALTNPTKGVVEVNGVNIATYNEKELARYRNKNIGFIFQSFYLEPTFTALENVCMPLTIAGIEKKVREEKAKKLLILLGLEEKIYIKANELSGGQKQRVSIARALINEPEIILADEPTGNLDSQNGLDVINLLRKIADSGKTVILVTHNMDDAKKADNLIEISDGIVYAKYMEKYKDMMENEKD